MKSIVSAPPRGRPRARVDRRKQEAALQGVIAAATRLVAHRDGALVCKCTAADWEQRLLGAAFDLIDSYRGARP
jgi:hypothetical protein